MGLEFWLFTIKYKTMVDEDNLESCEQIKQDLLMQNMLAREALLTTLSKIGYGEVNIFVWNMKFGLLYIRYLNVMNMIKSLDYRVV